MKKAVVTLTIGTKFEKYFKELCNLNWRRYCEKHGFDLIIIKDNLDNSLRATKRSPAWQKLLILSQSWSIKYDVIVWIDADVLINNNESIDISYVVPIEKVGAVETYSIPTREIHDISLKRLYCYYDQNKIEYINNLNPHDYYTNRNIKGGNLNEVVQTGVFVCSPRYHKEIFEHIYYNNEDLKGAEWNYEMPAMSFELLNAKMVHWISPRFNFCVLDLMAAFYPEILLNKKESNHLLLKKILNSISKISFEENRSKCLNNIFDLSIFMHFAGCQELMSKVRVNEY